MRLALYQPDIPPNTGTLLRMGACLGVAIDIIEPCGFPLSDRSFRRAGLDYLDQAEYRRHISWESFHQTLREKSDARLILLTTKSDSAYSEFRFQRNDTILVGRETAGVDADVHDAADARLCIPMVDGMRSLNVAIAAAMVVGEALRQIGDIPTRARPASDTNQAAE